MAITDNIITTAEVNALKVAAETRQRIQGEPDAVKTLLDRLPLKIVEKYNALIATLQKQTTGSGAEQIGCAAIPGVNDDESGTIREMLVSLKELIDNAVISGLVTNTVDETFLTADAVMLSLLTDYAIASAGTPAALATTDTVAEALGKIERILSNILAGVQAAGKATDYSTSGGIATALAGKQATLTWDTTPTAASNNPVRSDGIKTALDLKAPYDLVIKTQAQFEAMIADSTWFGAKSVALVGSFSLSTANNSGVKRPANVTRIDGYNNAKITVTNFVYDSTTAKGGLWDDENTNNPRCYITDLTVDCTSTAGTGRGFFGSNNTYTNCTGTGTGTGNGNGYGFYGNNNTYTNCTGTGNGNGYGFYGNNNTYTNCTGTGNGPGTGTGFFGSNNTYTNCTGTGTGISIGYGFRGDNNRIISCTALAYLSTDSIPSDTNCVPIYNSATSTNLFMIIRDCKFPQIAKTGYQQGTIWCNIANNTTMVGSIKDNVYHSRFTVAPIKGVNVVADNNSAVDITAI